MARKFLYVIVVGILLVAAALFALRLWGGRLTEMALVPTSQFEQQEPLAANAYADPALWYSHPTNARGLDPSHWQPQGALPAPDLGGVRYALFFVHPTSYFDRSHWNAPLADKAAQDQARLFLRGMASPLADNADVWAPQYRQATFGAMISAKPDARRAVDAAYADVAMAFDQFVASIPPEQPIVLAGHSQGALHLLRLMQRKIAGTPLQARIAAAYPIGWPISPAHDLPALGLPACTTAQEGGCLVSWASFAEPADPGMLLDVYRRTPGLDGQPKGMDPILCINPLTGTPGGKAGITANLGTLVPDDDLKGGNLVPGAVPARCGPDGLLLIGDPPQLGPFVLPGNNYHVYDIPLFWENLRADVGHRVKAWAASH